MLNLDRPFPFFLNDDKGNLLLIFCVSVFNYLFLLAFEPFGQDAATSVEQVLYSGICFVMLSFNLLLLPRISVKWLDSGNWTLGKYIWFNVYILVSISLVISVVNILRGTLDSTDFPIWKLFLVDLSHVTMLGIIPLSVITLLLRDRLLVQAVRYGSSATASLREFKERPAGPNGGEVTIHSDTKEVLSISSTSFMYAQAENNYTELYWYEADKVQHKLMRMTLKSLEEQLGNQKIIRCHRSFLVNLRMVNSVFGKANGYRLDMNHTETTIPVSRAMGKEVLEKIHNLAIAL